MSASPSFRDWVPEEAAVNQEGKLTPPSTSSNEREAPQSYPLPLPPAGSPPPPLRGLRQATLSTSGTRPAPDQSYPLPTPPSVPAFRPQERRTTPSAERQSDPLPTPAQDRAPGSQPAT